MGWRPGRQLQRVGNNRQFLRCRRRERSIERQRPGRLYRRNRNGLGVILEHDDDGAGLERRRLWAAGETTANMESQSTFSSWDFSGTWYLNASGAYAPTLRGATTILGTNSTGLNVSAAADPSYNINTASLQNFLGAGNVLVSTTSGPLTVSPNPVSWSSSDNLNLASSGWLTVSACGNYCDRRWQSGPLCRQRRDRLRGYDAQRRDNFNFQRLFEPDGAYSAVFRNQFQWRDARRRHGNGDRCRRLDVRIRHLSGAVDKSDYRPRNRLDCDIKFERRLLCRHRPGIVATSGSLTITGSSTSSAGAFLFAGAQSIANTLRLHSDFGKQPIFGQRWLRDRFQPDDVRNRDNFGFRGE